MRSVSSLIEIGVLPACARGASAGAGEGAEGEDAGGSKSVA
jgi:hypothetical protein